MAWRAERWSEAKAAYRELVETSVANHGGSVANFVGDNFMALFPDATRAVQSAIEIT